MLKFGQLKEQQEVTFYRQNAVSHTWYIKSMKIEKKADKKRGNKAPRNIIVGDVHGELLGLKEMLTHAGLIDLTDNLCGKESVLVQTGDVIDRGPHSVEAVRFLRRLQEQAAAAGEKVIRLCGNHELMLLQGQYYYTNFSDQAGLAAQLREEILVGKVFASYTDGTRLYTHAGLRSRIREAVEDGSHAGSGSGVLKELSDKLNDIFVESLKTGDLKTHPIFHADIVRGGSHEIGGIFWGDYSLIIGSENAYDIPQVFGHTPTQKNGVEHSHGLKLIDIDAGMYEGYGGHRVYLEIDRKGVVIEHSLKSGKWGRKELMSGIPGGKDFS